jgi:hypothetical protein
MFFILFYSSGGMHLISLITFKKAFVDEPGKQRRYLSVDSDQNVVQVPDLGPVNISVKSILLAERPGLHRAYSSTSSQ